MLELKGGIWKWLCKELYKLLYLRGGNALLNSRSTAPRPLVIPFCCHLHPVRLLYKTINKYTIVTLVNNVKIWFEGVCLTHVVPGPVG